MSESIAVIACCKTKAAGPGAKLPADQLYIGSLFRAQLAYTRQVLVIPDDHIFVASCKYGLVGMWQEIEGYDLTLSDMSRLEKTQWGYRIRGEVTSLVPLPKLIYLLAGGEYRKALLEPLGWVFTVERPIPAGLGYGQQVNWLRRQL